MVTKDKSKEKKDSRPFIQTSCYIDYKKNILYEQTKQGNFIYFNNGSQKICNKISTKNYDVVPIDDKVTKIDAIKLPTGIEDYDSTKKLILDIDKHIYRFLDISNQMRKLASWYIPMTWIIERLNTINYLRALGTWGAGKTRFFDVIGGICYKPIPMGGSVRPAPIYRLMDKWKGTTLFDEMVIQKSDESNDIVQILNMGIQRGKFVWRCDSEDKHNVEPFNPFGAKIIASRKEFGDNALDSRCITEHMKETTRNDIPIELPHSFYTEQAKLRNKLLKFRMEHWHKPSSNTPIKIPDTIPRLKQMMLPFALIYRDYDNIMQDLNKFIKGVYKERVEQKATSWEGGIVLAIFDLALNESMNFISADDIKERMLVLGYEAEKLSIVGLGKMRGGLGIDSKVMTIQHHSKNCIIWNSKVMLNLLRKYVPIEKQQRFKDLLKTRDFDKRVIVKEKEEEIFDNFNI